MTIIRPLTGILVGLLAASSLAAQNDQAALIEKRNAKLDADFLSFTDWITNYETARATAKETGKPIFAYFTRSYSP